jgi:alkanesulfonate monooxygenase
MGLHNTGEERSVPIEFIGMIATQEQSEIRPRSGPVVDLGFVRDFARAHEEGGFDKVLIGYSAARPDGLQVAAYAAAHTERLHFLVAHRPGFVFPTVAGRAFASLDQFTEGRVALHTISGGNDAEQRRDGDYLSKDERYARTDEYLEVLKSVWTSSAPFSFEGRFYRFENFSTEVRPFQQPSIPIYFGGSSEAAIKVGARHADVFALWGEPLAETAAQIAAVRAEAAKYGRSPKFSVSFRPILGATEDLAWERAQRILASVQDHVRASKGQFAPSHLRYSVDRQPENAGSQRLLAAAAAGERHDRALWTPLAAATGAAGNSTALVGTPETVARALLDYVEIGVTTVLIRGYDPYDDATACGRDLLPLVRAMLGPDD